MKNLSNKEKAAKIRKKLKQDLGLTSRDVSVRTTRGSSINVIIKTEKALKNEYEVERKSKKLQHIRRDRASGEILSGGNTYISFSVDESAYKSKLQKAEDIFKYLENDKGITLRIIGIDGAYELCIPKGQNPRNAYLFVEKPYYYEDENGDRQVDPTSSTVERVWLSAAIKYIAKLLVKTGTKDIDIKNEDSFNEITK